MDKNIHICIATDDNFAQHCSVVIKSAINNKNDEDELFFHVLDGGISEENKEKLIKTGPNVNIIEVNPDDFIKYEIVTKRHWALPTLFRLKMPSLLKNISKVIYLDCDVVVRQSLNDFYNTELENYYLAGVEDNNSENSKNRLKLSETSTYINAGVTLVNLEKWRKDQIEEKCFEYLNQNYKTLYFGDQDVMNAVLQNKIKILDKNHNYITPSKFLTKKDIEHWNNIKKDIIVLHYAGQKPWELYYQSEMKDEYWFFHNKCPWANLEKYKKFRDKQKRAHFRPFLAFRYAKRYPLFLFTKRRKEFFDFFR